MEPIEFNKMNHTYANNQKPYLPLPCHTTLDGIVTSCWRMSWSERFKSFLTGRMYLSTMTFNQPLQPCKLETSFTDHA